MNSLTYPVQPFFFLLLAMVGQCSADGTIRVFDQREFVTPTAYQELVTALQGKEPTRALFASQQVQLLSFSPRDVHGDDQSSDEAQGLRATIDICGYSAEFGSMQYVMTINASDEATSIDVSLTRPVGMLRGQTYQFRITPRGASHSSIHIAHTLHVRLKQRRLKLVNQAILNNTCREANARVRELTHRMSCSFASLALRASSAKSGPREEESETAEVEQIGEDAQRGTGNAMGRETKRFESNSDPKADAKKLNLTVIVAGANGIGGEMRIALFNSKEQYMAFDARKEEARQGDAFRKDAVKIGAGNQVVYSFEGIPPGTYAIAAFHDQDGNKKLNSNFLGLPSEPYGLTRDARGSLGMPPYEDATIELSEKSFEFRFNVK